jgi:predicted RecB family nuclease
MPIAQETFDAFLKCSMKSYLNFNGIVGLPSEFSQTRGHLEETYKQACREHLCSVLRDRQWYAGTPDRQSLENLRYSLIFDYVVSLPRIHAQLHALEEIRVLRRGADRAYIPIRFVPREKLTTYDKLLLAFDAFAFSQVSGKTPHVGGIIHGCDYATLTVRLEPLIQKVQLVLGSITNQQVKGPPPLILNKHCAECEFRSRCRQIAIQKDDLSLLPTLSEKGRKKQNEKGIFTVIQLSYTFRCPRRSADVLPRHQPALKALAIRKNQIHILGSPTICLSGTPVYIDVEGDPDRDFYYLVGLRISSGSSSAHYSYWANTPADERAMWADCLHKVTEIANPRLIHYGAYETQFLRRMRSRYQDIASASLLDELISSAQNLLSIIYAQVYFPTYSNGLKDVANYLGFRWSDDAPSGLTALAWRSRWESTHEANLKEKLLTYNSEDCVAAEKVAAAVAAVCRPVSTGGTNPLAINADSLKREYPQRFGEVEFVFPEFKQINKAAYWDYQRNKVYVRSIPRVKGQRRTLTHQSSLTEIPVNKAVAVEEQRPDSCPRCNSTLIYRYGKLSQTVYDLKLSPAGVKRWTTRFSFSRFICWHCKATLQLYRRKDKYGVSLRAYLLYQIIELQIPQNTVAQSIKQLFNLPLSRGSINRLKATEANRFEEAYKSILQRVVAGKLVHADETKVEIEEHGGYVWVFTNLEDVAFVYSETREGTTPQRVLSNFTGVLVSDFYAAYDSIQCAQQKCLIHLMRDINEDLVKQPFNEEMKELGRDFANMVKPMIDTVDHFGLKACHLRKHKQSVNRFFAALSRRDYQTEVAAGYKKRFERNCGKLFTFLDHDGVPWNNNNAEHAIKAFARLRRSIGGKSSAKGIRDYLVLLSISETCKSKGVNFLRFVQFGHAEVDSLCARPSKSAHL